MVTCLSDAALSEAFPCLGSMRLTMNLTLPCGFAAPLGAVTATSRPEL